MSVDLAMPAVSEPRAGEATRTSGFLQRSLPVYFILGTFFVVTLPFSLYAVAEPDFFKRYGGLVVFYLCFFSITHFVLTLTIYLQSANLRYFSSTRINRAVYFLIPISIFVLFDLYSVLQVAAAFPVFCNPVPLRDSLLRFSPLQPAELWRIAALQGAVAGDVSQVA
jgi:hypothetical protein